MEAVPPAETKRKERSKGRSRRSRENSQRVKNPVSTPEKAAVSESRTPQPAEDVTKSLTRDGVPVISPSNPEKPSGVTTKSPKSGKDRRRGHERVVLDAPPAAREAAFSGPPRYDWIDIETAAAIKVQSVARRNQVMSDMEAEGKTTAAIRNRSRRRKAQRDTMASDDAPGLFQCCGVGLIFGDATEEDPESSKIRDRDAYYEKQQAKLEREAELRQYRPRVKTAARVEESVEIVE